MVTNGLGGFASGSLAGANTRRYHGLLIAALDPPARRVLLVSRLEEEATSRSGTFKLFTNVFRDRVDGFGHLRLLEYRQDPFPRFRYLLGGKVLDKTVLMVRGRNTTVVTYTLVAADEPLDLRIRVLVNYRDYHWVSAPGSVRFETEELGRGCRVTPASSAAVTTVVTADGGVFTGEGQWTGRYYYPAEAERGLEADESHFAVGSLAVRLEPGEERGIVLSAEKDPGACVIDVREAVRRESSRLEAVVGASGLEDPFAADLVRASDAFLVERRSTGAPTVIAGYPWFADWGRDALVALPGLTLVTRRFGEARSILAGFAGLVSGGLVPNTFDEATGTPAYNSIDAPLWLIYAADKYLHYTGDLDFVRRELYGAMRCIIESLFQGTRFGIRVDPADGLLEGGAPGVQLTWMDAKPGDWVVTPRHGKPVEVNALWFNALAVMARLSAAVGEAAAADRLSEAASRAAGSFVRTFWRADLGFLQDFVGPGQDSALRPNQLIALFLPRDLVPAALSASALSRIISTLLVPCGVRTLSPHDRAYKGRFTGDQRQRDAAYHQGTAWAWLLGPLVTAITRVWGQTKTGLVEAMFSALRHHLQEAGIGQISEVFEGDPPHEPKGCYAQAWSVAEALRSYTEDYLRIRPCGGDRP